MKEMFIYYNENSWGELVGELLSALTGIREKELGKFLDVMCV